MCAVRIENAAVVSFGTFAAAVTLTGYDVLDAVDDAVIFPYKTFRNSSGVEITIDVEAGAPVQYSIGTFDMICIAGEANNAGLNNILRAGFEARDIKIRLYTSSTQQVTDSGYSVPTVTNFTFTNEADPTN